MKQSKVTSTINLFKNHAAQVSAQTWKIKSILPVDKNWYSGLNKCAHNIDCRYFQVKQLIIKDTEIKIIEKEKNSNT